MFHIWWPTFIVPVLMVICGLLGRRIPGLHYHSPSGVLEDEQQRFADNQLYQMLWRFGLVFAALAFMVMRSVRLMPERAQDGLMYGAVALEVLGVVLMVLPIERAIAAQFDEETNKEKGDHA